MLNTMQNKSMWGARLKGVLAAFLVAGSGAVLAANVTVDLCATTGSITLPALPSPISVWGYAPGVCSLTATVGTPGGPVISVNVGDVVTVNLQNKLTQATGLLFQGQSMVPDVTGVPAAVSTFPGKSYIFTATNPGTFLYEAALLPNAEYQGAMGLHGALIVRPAPVAYTSISVKPTSGPARTDATATYASGSNVVADTAILVGDVGATVSGAGISIGATITAVTAGTSFTMSAPAAAAYGASTDFNEEAVLVLSEIDPELNTSANPAGFDMRTYAPKYFLINGKPYPDTTPIASAAGHKVLLRYVNAGAKHHSMAVLGLRQIFVAKDASTLPTLNHNVAAETLAPGQTGDAIVTVPAVTTASKFAVYDASLALHNSNTAGFGGMLTFVTTGGPAAAAGPVVTALALAGSNLSATIAAGTGKTVTASEYWIDAGAHAPITFTAGTTVTVTTTIPAQPSGDHILYVRGQDNTLTWGAPRSVAFAVDTTGPTTSGLVLTPNPSSGLVSVALSATANDSASGGSNVTAAEYSIDGGAPVAMTLGGAPAPVRSLTASIPAGLTTGNHAVAVRSQDALSNWGAPVTITLNVVNTPPVTSNVSASKNPNNGTVPLNSTQAVVRVTATMTSSGSTVSAAEGFIDSNPATTVRGFPFVPSDGVWNGAVETGYADIPLTTINALTGGNHTIYVRGKDAAGNWGATATTILIIDRVVPTITSVAPSPATIVFGTASVALNLAASDTGGAGLAGGQYWIDGTATPPTNVTAFTGTSVSINTSALSAGSHTVYVRVQDAATNWSTVSSVTLYVMQAVIDAYTTAISNNNAGNNRTQSFTVSQGSGVLTNDQPIGVAGRTATPTAPVVTKAPGAGVGTMAVALGSNGGFTYTLTVPSTVTGNANIRAAKRGTYQFTYAETLNGVTSTAMVTITVNLVNQVLP